MKFLHVVRDGRDMAFSENQNQLRKHGNTVLGTAESQWSQPLRAVALWTRHNLRVAEYGEARLASQYLRIRYEDVCAKPVETVAQIFEFFGLDRDREDVALSEVQSSPSIGRWRTRDPAIVDGLREVAAPALAKFGY